MFEYRLEHMHLVQDVLLNFMPDPSAAEQLNQWARQGWELVAATEGTFYLRREVLPSPYRLLDE